MMRKSFLGAFPLSVVALVAIRAGDHHSLLAAVGIEGGLPLSTERWYASTVTHTVTVKRVLLKATLSTAIFSAEEAYS